MRSRESTKSKSIPTLELSLRVSGTGATSSADIHVQGAGSLTLDGGFLAFKQGVRFSRHRRDDGAF
jgi:hypothetical protein